jgi:2-polyprenyl-3-methyl-5-hydroxy-6-metoxy-1,4-benzoquinol methylase
VSISVDRERGFYDAQYAKFLAAPDHELVCTRQTLLRDLNNPRHPIWERRRLHLLVLEHLLAEGVRGVRVLDYGCGTGDWGLMLASEGADVTLLDLSPRAIELVERRAAAGGVKVRGFARDASDLSCFRAGEFDLIYASAALHHTLKYSGALDELARVLRPGGRLVLAETWGNNPLLKVARRVRARIAREAEEQGEEIILGDAEIALLRTRFSSVEVTPLNLFAMGKRLFRGHLQHARAVIRALEAADQALLGAIPSLRNWCGEAMVIARR